MSTFGTGTPSPQETSATVRAKPGELLKRESFAKDTVIFREGGGGVTAPTPSFWNPGGSASLRMPTASRCV